jgi:hypothetical protein
LNAKWLVMSRLAFLLYQSLAFSLRG